MTHLPIEIGSLWEITTVYGVYTVEVTEFGTYKGGSLSGHYSCYGQPIGIGTFPLRDITKMVKI